MKTLRAILSELIGLFVDDRSLVLRAVAVIAIAALARVLVPGVPLLSGGILLAGCVTALLQSASVGRPPS
jgi:hypothetical protein